MHLNKGLVKLEKESYIPKEKGKEKEIGVLLATAAWSTTGSVYYLSHQIFGHMYRALNIVKK